MGYPVGVIPSRPPPDSDLLVFAETQLCGFPCAANVRQLAESLDGPSVQACCTTARPICGRTSAGC